MSASQKRRSAFNCASRALTPTITLSRRSIGAGRTRGRTSTRTPLELFRQLAADGHAIVVLSNECLDRYKRLDYLEKKMRDKCSKIGVGERRRRACPGTDRAVEAGRDEIPQVPGRRHVAQSVRGPRRERRLLRGRRGRRRERRASPACRSTT